MLERAFFIPLLPLISAVLILFFGKWLPRKGASLAIVVMGWNVIHSVSLIFQGLTGKVSLPYETAMTWLSVGVYDIEFGVYIDGLTLVMLLVVTIVSLLVQVYSLGYMHGDPRFKRYYAYMSLFSAAMLGLVMANNMVLFFMCWELVGVCSYLLIGFWFEKPEAARAGKKAFIVTKLGDLGFYVGILLLFTAAGTFRISMLQNYVELGYMSQHIAATIAILLFCGAIGKSAQVPLFVWLPDAMEGPSPVSALIHAATMVAAGVFMVARLYFLYAFAPVSLEVVAWVGVVTAFLAATMALVAYDIKRVLAFSTISQLGYMMLGLGTGSCLAGMFHLTSHAFFKALLFLGAGSVIHSMHTNDMREMGGLSRKMPVTFITFLIAALAISGIPPLSGYFTKDMILAQAYIHSKGIYLLAAFTAAITAFYMFRLCFMTFHGTPRNSERYLHSRESPATMTVPLSILAFLSLFAGMFLSRGDLFKRIIGLGGYSAHTVLQHQGHVSHIQIAVSSTAIAVIGILLAYRLYLKSPEAAARIKGSTMPIFKALDKRYGFDVFYLWLVDISDALAGKLRRFDYHVIDQFLVDGFGLATRALGWISDVFDRVFVDSLCVNGTGSVTKRFGRLLRAAQSGFVQNYLLYIALAATLFCVFAVP